MAVIWQWIPKLWGFIIEHLGSNKPASAPVPPQPVTVNVTVNTDNPAGTKVSSPEVPVEVNSH